MRIELKESFIVDRIGKNTYADLNAFDLMCERAVPIEKHVEAALVLDGHDPHQIRLHIRDIRHVLFIYRNHPLSAQALDKYLHEILTQGTRESTPYRRVSAAIQNYDIRLW